MQQPKVIGEMFAGIMLGPSLLEWVYPMRLIQEERLPARPGQATYETVRV